ncbi:uncharacterized protein FFB20_11132 [Fusarium fujikuroi]|nr:uncharacterized protein FFC1_02859 [Fusarium fujikuroi]SCN86065.1 uncharacterized protein FFE2_05852 [Fusarium fujikuroi]SCN92280.1 uncharacterized protein FFM5_05299 [Fusarium fujikuroi]SCO00244.1 uncharacterized protein FFB20_11132 [Fusarium fujikuroi]SCO31624.1 uncharacterized protein FFNC_02316 [Fusarium fujikuroi]
MPHGPRIGGCQCIPLAPRIIGEIAGTGVCVDIDGECVALGSAWKQPENKDVAYLSPTTEDLSTS